jgi:hypothetical protein
MAHSSFVLKHQSIPQLQEKERGYQLNAQLGFELFECLWSNAGNFQ